MFTVSHIHFDKSASEHTASINLEARRECEAIMQKIYEENPSYWPYGLDIAAHDGGVYMIREASTKKPIGFTGWQERMDGNTKVGYYSIGILPEYRNNGYAKQAVAKLIAIKSANVDRVQALVMRSNKPSLALAEALHIPVVKMGTAKKAVDGKDLVKILAGGLGSAGFMDLYTYGKDKSFDDYLNTPFSASRGAQALANTIFGGAAFSPGLAVAERLAAMAAIPAKDVAVAAIPAIPAVTESIKNMSHKPGLSEMLASLTGKQKAIGLGAGLAGVLGAGYLGNKAVNAIRDMASAQRENAKGRIRVALPTKDPDDQETTIEMPIDNLNVARSQFEKLQRDLRRRLRKENKERTVRRAVSMFEPKEAAADKDSLHRVKNLITILNG